MRLVGSTKKTQKIDHAPGMEVGGHVPGWAAECGTTAAKPSEFFARVPVECPPTLTVPTLTTFILSVLRLQVLRSSRDGLDIHRRLKRLDAAAAEEDRARRALSSGEGVNGRKGYGGNKVRETKGATWPYQCVFVGMPTSANTVRQRGGR